MAIFRYRLTQTRSCEISIIAKDKKSADETITKTSFEDMCDDTIEVLNETAQFVGLDCIMTEHNGHNPNLVEVINKAYFYANADFKQIAAILAERYKDDIHYHFDENFTPKDYIEKYMSEFLSQVCDDMDLRTIISWCRMSEED